MPFQSEAQHRKFRVLLRQGKITQNQFDEWMDETKKKYGKKHPIKPLPERVKQAFLKAATGYPSHTVNMPATLSETDELNDNREKWKRKDKNGNFMRGFTKAAGGPGSGVAHPNTDAIDFLETSPIISIGYRKKFMEFHNPIQKAVKIQTDKIKYKGQEKMVPKKVIKMMRIWDEVKEKPVDVIRDKKGFYHILDGHHRCIAAILLKEPTVIANVYKAPQELE